MENLVDPTVGDWLDRLGLSRYRALFAAQEIDAETLLEVTEQDLEAWEIPFGPRKRLTKAIAALQAVPASAAAPVAAAHAGGAGDRTGNAERRQVTVMFCDMVGSSKIAARHDPEDVREVMRAYRDICNAAIARFEGFVVRYFGDGVLAVFGWPTAHEDDAERAVRAGLTIVQDIRQSQPLPGVTPHVRVGIATGLTVVGDLIGEGASQETSLVGETPNLAARLQHFAEADTVVIAAGTRRLIGNLFNLKEVGPLELREIPGPVPAWQVMGEALFDSRFAAVRSSERSDLVGRSSEMALLVDRWQQARHGEGQVVLLSGQAGIGKSSLVEALRERLEDQPHGLMRVQCSSYHRNSALYPVVGLVQALAGIEAEDTTERRLMKLAALLGESGQDYLPLYADLLSLPTEGLSPPVDPDPQVRKEAILDALIDRLKWNASFRPVLLLLEDAHWIDPTTRELVERTIPILSGLPVMMVVTFRPDADPGWGDYAWITRLQLNRLNRRSCATMAQRIAGGKMLPREVMDAILAKTDGVPLFVEELTKMLLESGQMREAGDGYVLNRPLRQIEVPTTLQDSLMARLDRLGSVKQIAQIGAVIGREFPYPLLAALVPMGEAELRDALAQLAEAELLFRQGEPPEASYSFKHALVQDAAYASLLRSNRQLWHGKIARTLQRDMPEIAQTEPEILGRHYTEAGMAVDAVDWLQRAGELAIRRSADVEAAGHLGKALELLETLPADAARDARELDLRVAISGSLFTTQGYSSAIAGENCQRAYDLCQSVGSARRLFPTLWGRFSNLLVRAEIPAAIEEALRFQSLARMHDEDALMAMAHRNLGVVYLTAGQPALARQHIDQAESLMRPEDRAEYTFAYGLDPLITLLSTRALVLLQLGELDAAEDAARAALEEAQATRHFASHAYALMRTGLYRMLRNDCEALTPHSAELRRVSQQRNGRTWGFYGEILTGWCEARSGAVDTGIARMETGIAALRQQNGQLFVSLLRFEQAAILLDDAQTKPALACLEAARSMIDPGGQRIGESEFYRLRAIALHQLAAPAADIAAALDRALQVAEAQPAPFFRDRVLRTRAALTGAAAIKPDETITPDLALAAG